MHSVLEYVEQKANEANTNEQIKCGKHYITPERSVSKNKMQKSNKFQQYCGRQFHENPLFTPSQYVLAVSQGKSKVVRGYYSLINIPKYHKD